MDFVNTPTSGGDSYEKPKPGKYIGVLCGFAFIGTQPSSGFGAKPAVLLRWELHKRKGPSMDSKNFIHTVTAKFGATIRGDNSRLKKAIEAHFGAKIEEGQKIRSQDWLGKAAWLDLKASDDEKYINVDGISPLDPEDDAAPSPTLPFEHWEPTDTIPPPGWAQFWVGRSTDLAHLVEARPRGGNGAPVGAGVGVGDETDDIPF
jgi:hypothetical protein